MSYEITKQQTPEEQELEKKLSELASFETELANRELDLATLTAELAAFEIRYLRIVGILYAELDEIEAEIAAAQARLSPNDRKAQQKAADARAQAEQSAQSAGTVHAPGEQVKFVASENLKKLYREIAKRIHPDLATNDADHTRRQKFMVEANLAYQEGDEAKLQAILNEWESSPESVEGEGVGAELIRVIRKIAQIQRRLGEIETEITQLDGSELYRLWTKTDEAEKQGRDLLEEIASQVEQEIDAARKRLAAIGENSAAK